jgi:hypothetical protein
VRCSSTECVAWHLRWVYKHVYLGAVLLAVVFYALVLLGTGVGIDLSLMMPSSGSVVQGVAHAMLLLLLHTSAALPQRQVTCQAGDGYCVCVRLELLEVTSTRERRLHVSRPARPPGWCWPQEWLVHHGVVQNLMKFITTVPIRAVVFVWDCGGWESCNQTQIWVDSNHSNPSVLQHVR